MVGFIPRLKSWAFSLISCNSVLVIDDSVATGNQMTETRARLDEHDFSFDIKYGTIYISPRGYQYVDYWSAVVPLPRVFEWNVLHHTRLTDFCVDLDGVLRRDPIPETNDDEDNHREYLTNIKPNIVPKQRIGWLVSSRVEEYRPETERWLDIHGIDYETLVMRSTPEIKNSRKQNNYAEYKAGVYDSTDSDLFIENDHNQAVEICEKTSKPVFCYDTKEMVKPGIVDRSRRKATESVYDVGKDPILYPARAASQLLRQGYHLISRVWQK